LPYIAFKEEFLGEKLLKPAAFSFSGCKGKGASVISQFGKENKIKNRCWL
jgi:hypothetical protein